MRPFSPDYANYTPTNEQRAEVRRLARSSRPIEAISEQLDLPVPVLNYYFAKELESIPDMERLTASSSAPLRGQGLKGGSVSLRGRRAEDRAGAVGARPCGGFGLGGP